MTERKQIGPRVPPEVWQMFKEYSEEKHGKQGMASEELTEAMISHVKDEGASDNETMEQLESQLDTLNMKLDYILMAMRNMENSTVGDPEQQNRF